MPQPVLLSDEQAQWLRDHPSESLRRAGRAIGVSHETVRNWRRDLGVVVVKREQQKIVRARRVETASQRAKRVQAYAERKIATAERRAELARTLEKHERVRSANKAAAITARDEKLRELHAKGMTVPEASSASKWSEVVVRGTWRRLGLKAPPASPALRTARYVYFFVDREADRVKIGCTKDPHARLRCFVTPNPFLELLGVLDGGAQLESELHERFARARLRGEFFKLSAIESDIARLGLR